MVSGREAGVMLRAQLTSSLAAMRPLTSLSVVNRGFSGYTTRDGESSTPLSWPSRSIAAYARPSTLSLVSRPRPQVRLQQHPQPSRTIDPSCNSLARL